MKFTAQPEVSITWGHTGAMAEWGHRADCTCSPSASVWMLHFSLHLDGLPRHFDSISCLINVLWEGSTVLLCPRGHFQHLKFLFISFSQKVVLSKPGSDVLPFWTSYMHKTLYETTIFRTWEVTLRLAPKVVPLFLSSWFHQVWIVQREQIEKREVPGERLCVSVCGSGDPCWANVPWHGNRYQKKHVDMVRGLVRYVLKRTLSTTCLTGKTKANIENDLCKRKEHQTD